MSRTILGFVLLLFWCTRISLEVKWESRTDPIVFGRNVILFCVLPEKFDRSYPRIWRSGGTVLALDESSSNRNKYEGSLEKEGFTLTIKTFLEEDFQRNYTCSYGFEDYRATLTTENYQWIPQPDKYEVDEFYSTIEMINFTLKFQKVYPEPNCTSLIGHKAIPADFIVSSHVVDRYFLATNLTLEYKFDVFDCGEEVTVLCKIGNSIVTVNIPTHRQCAEDAVPDSTSTTGVAVAVGLFSVITVATVFVGCRKYRTKKSPSDGMLELKKNCKEQSNGTAQWLDAKSDNKNETPPAEEQRFPML